MELPIYEYECTCCPSRFELRRGFHEDTPVSCPRCGGKARQRFSSVPIIFKGSGFYVTDNRGGQSYTSTGSTDESKSTATPAAPASESKESPKPAAVKKTETVSSAAKTPDR
jgi:putative FmdB family regulatory protein